MTRKSLLAFASMLFTVAPVMADTDITAIDNILYSKPTTIKAGTTGELSINMKNSADVQSIGFYFYLPNGMSVTSTPDGLMATLSTQRTTPTKHSMFKNYLENANEYRVAILQTTGAAFNGNDGEVMTIKVSVPENTTPGDYIFKMSEQEFSNINGILMNNGVFEGTITVTDPVGVKDIMADVENGNGDIYTTGGIKTASMQKGINIVKQDNGKVIKIIK